MKCSYCGIEEELTIHSKTWWNLWDYHHITGTFCPSCFKKVDHDVNGNPKHPEEFAKIAATMKLKNTTGV